MWMVVTRTSTAPARRSDVRSAAVLLRPPGTSTSPAAAARLRHYEVRHAALAHSRRFLFFAPPGPLSPPFFTVLNRLASSAFYTPWPHPPPPPRTLRSPVSRDRPPRSAPPQSSSPRSSSSGVSLTTRCPRP